MEQISKILSHNKQTYYYLIANLFQKTAFFGVRYLIVADIILSTIAQNVEDTGSLTFTITAMYIICRVFGALLGDFVLSNKRAGIIGGILQTIGICFFIFQTKWMSYTGIAFFALGAGAFNINLVSMYGKLYLNKITLLDSAFTMFYTSIHLGAFFGSIVLVAIAMTSLKIAFLIAAVLVLLSTILFLFLETPNHMPNVVQQFNEYKSRHIFIGFAIALVTLFWFLYQLAGESLPSLRMKYSADAFFNSTQMSWYSSFSDSFVLIMGLAFSIIWSYFYSKQFNKLSIGFVLTAISFAVIMLSPDINLESGGFEVVLSLLFMSLGEIFIAPVICSALTKYSDSKYLATSMSMAKLPLLLLPFASTQFSSKAFLSEETAIKFVTISLFVFGLVSYLIFNSIDINKSKRKFLNEAID
jgi:dipeptide/tripeptide permease